MAGLVWVAFASGCAPDDDCDRYCDAAAANLDRCVPAWGWDWQEDLGFEDADAWRRWCRGWWSDQVAGAEEAADGAGDEVLATCAAKTAEEEGSPDCDDLLGR